MRSRVGPSESGWTKSMIERPTTSSAVRAPMQFDAGAVRVDDPAALVHDDAVGAQVDEAPVAVDQLAHVRLDELAVADVDDEARAADDLAVFAHLAGPHQEVLHLAGRALERLLELVVAPRRAGLQRRDDRGDEPFGRRRRRWARYRCSG